MKTIGLPLLVKKVPDSDGGELHRYKSLKFKTQSVRINRLQYMNYKT